MVLSPQIKNELANNQKEVLEQVDKKIDQQFSHYTNFVKDTIQSTLKIFVTVLVVSAGIIGWVGYAKLGDIVKNIEKTVTNHVDEDLAVDAAKKHLGQLTRKSILLTSYLSQRNADSSLILSPAETNALIETIGNEDSEEEYFYMAVDILSRIDSEYAEEKIFNEVIEVVKKLDSQERKSALIGMFATLRYAPAARHFRHWINPGSAVSKYTRIEAMNLSRRTFDMDAIALYQQAIKNSQDETIIFQSTLGLSSLNPDDPLIELWISRLKLQNEHIRTLAQAFDIAVNLSDIPRNAKKRDERIQQAQRLLEIIIGNGALFVVMDETAYRGKREMRLSRMPEAAYSDPSIDLTSFLSLSVVLDKMLREALQKRDYPTVTNLVRSITFYPGSIRGIDHPISVVRMSLYDLSQYFPKDDDLTVRESAFHQTELSTQRGETQQRTPQRTSLYLTLHWVDEYGRKRKKLLKKLPDENNIVDISFRFPDLNNMSSTIRGRYRPW